MKKKDALLVAAVLVAAFALIGVNALLPKRSIEDYRPAEGGGDDVVIIEEEIVSSNVAFPRRMQSAAWHVPLLVASAIAEEEPAAAKASAVGPVGPAPVTVEKVRGYVVVTVNGRQYGDPIPMDREKIITIRQSDDKINRVHITPNSVVMESSTCENQDCVGEGEVTLDNYKTRILSTYIICLPNGVQIEMVPAEEE